MTRSCLLTTPRFSVERRLYGRPEEPPVVRDVVVHAGAVVILPLFDPDHFLLVRQYRHAPEVELWELPAGTLEPNEPPMEAARRELLEETGYQAETLEPLLEFYSSPGILTERMRCFTASGLTWTGQQLDPAEQITVEKMSWRTARRQLVRGEFRDAKTIAVLGTYLARMIDQEA
jgi:ADP-ribose pyrophosphatase